MTLQVSLMPCMPHFGAVVTAVVVALTSCWSVKCSADLCTRKVVDASMYCSIVPCLANEQCLHGKLFGPIHISIVLSIDWCNITVNLSDLASHDFTRKPHAMHATLWCSSYNGGRGTHQSLICEVQCWPARQKSCACIYVCFYCATHGKWAMSSWEVVLSHTYFHCVKYWLIQHHSKSGWFGFPWLYTHSSCHACHIMVQ